MPVGHGRHRSYRHRYQKKSPVEAHLVCSGTLHTRTNKAVTHVEVCKISVEGLDLR